MPAFKAARQRCPCARAASRARATRRAAGEGGSDLWKSDDFGCRRLALPRSAPCVHAVVNERDWYVQCSRHRALHNNPTTASAGSQRRGGTFHRRPRYDASARREPR
eukprot:3541469-Prymnesium_polylepis.1